MRGSYSQITGSDGKLYGKVDFDKFMVQFASDRFIDFEIVSDEAAGLKIPVSSVTSKEVFTVPVDYLTQGETPPCRVRLLKGSLFESGESPLYLHRPI